MAATAKNKPAASPRRKSAGSAAPAPEALSQQALPQQALPQQAASPVKPRRQPARKGQLDEAARATAHAQRLLSGLDTLTAALDKVSALPDPERPERFSAMVSEASAFAARWVQRLDVSPADQPWASARLHEAFLRAAPLRAGEGTVAATDAVVAAALAHTPASDPPPAPKTASPENIIPVRLALVCALLPVCAAQSEFGFLRKDPEDDMEEVAARVVASADALFTACTRGASPGAAAPEVRRMALSCCGTLMATAWRAEASVAQDVFKRRGIDMRAWRRANPDGFPLEHVFKRFADLATILERLVVKVAMKD